MVVTTDRAAMALEVEGAAAAVVRPLTAEVRSWPSTEGSIDTVVVVTTDRATRTTLTSFAGEGEPEETKERCV